MIDLKIFFLNNLIIFIFLLINVSNLLTYFERFLSFLKIYSIDTRNAKNTNLDIILTKPSSFDDKNIYTRIVDI